VSRSAGEEGERVFKELEAAFSDAFAVTSARGSPSGETASSFVSKLIQDSDAVIAITTEHAGPKLQNELAIATSLAKPTFLVMPSGEKIPSFLAGEGVRVFHYSPGRPFPEKDRLIEKVSKVSVSRRRLPSRTYERFAALVVRVLEASGLRLYKPSTRQDTGVDYLAVWRPARRKEKGTMLWDLIAEAEAKGRTPERAQAKSEGTLVMAVECKYSSRPLTLQTVRAAASLKLESDLPVLVTNTRCSREASDAAKELDILVIDGADLKRIAYELRSYHDGERLLIELEDLIDH